MKRVIAETSVKVLVDAVRLDGVLSIPPNPKGIVLVVQANGTEASRLRVPLIASALHEEGLATLAFSLLNVEEKKEDVLTRELRFNIPLLSHRLLESLKWISSQEELASLEFAFLAKGTAVAAALCAAAELKEKVKGVICVAGRPDLAGGALQKVQAHTLLIVGSEDHGVIEINEKAFGRLLCEKKLAIVNGAGHRFEEPGTLEEVGHLSAEWLSSI